MAQHDMNIANQGFPATRADINNALQALVSNSSGTSAPSTTFANQWWYDTTNNKLYIRNEANNAWIQVAVLDQTNNEWQITTGQITAGDSDGLVFKTDDGNTRITLSDGGDVTFADGTDVITASAGTDNVRIGEGAGDSIASGGDNNVAIGKDAGTAISTGDLNVAVGSNALKTISTHSNNTVIGAFALDSGTGNSNVAVGSGALGNASYAADNNIGIGKDALNGNTTGDSNVAVGYEALLTNSTAGNNTAVGYQAGRTTATGDSNTFVGQQAGYSTVGNRNTFVGRFAGNASNLASTQQNTFVGCFSGRYVTSGAKNTILGAYDGNQGSVDIRTSSNHIVLSDGDGNPRIHYDSSLRNWTLEDGVGIGTLKQGLTTVGTSFTTVMDMTFLGGSNSERGFYLVTISREGASVGTHAVLIVGLSTASLAILYDTIVINGLTIQSTNGLIQAKVSSSSVDVHATAFPIGIHGGSS